MVTSEWQNKLPDFVKRLEEALYRYAQTKVRTESRRPALRVPWDKADCHRCN